MTTESIPRRRVLVGFWGVLIFGSTATIARAELIVIDSNIESLKAGTRLEENAIPKLPRGGVIKVFNTRTNTTSEIKAPATRADDTELGGPRGKVESR